MELSHYHSVTGIAELGLAIKIAEYESSVAGLNFDKLKWKLTRSVESSWDENLCGFAEREYRKFLSLKKWYPKLSLVPSKLVDKFWHEHILDTQSYIQDCNNVFGYYLHHFPYFGIYGADDQQKLQTAFAETITLYEQHFGKYPSKQLFGTDANNAARCQDHACHAPTTCACRTPGACK